MKDISEEHGNAKTFGAAPSMDELAKQTSVNAPIEKRGNVVAQPQAPKQVIEAGMTANKADRYGFTMSQTIALLAFVAALFGVSVHAINSSSNARFDDINARFDRLEIRIDERFNEIDERFDKLEAKVDANTVLIARLGGESVSADGSSDGS
ncbi:MAG: hypothetical protein OXG53_04875 [Chloroflexi bacterium]|nr:hypothetical protein [Chloroflexota bacterium]